MSDGRIRVRKGTHSHVPNKDGVLVIDPCKIDTNSKEDDKCEALKTGMYSCSDCRKKYWLTEVTDND